MRAKSPYAVGHHRTFSHFQTRVLQHAISESLIRQIVQIDKE